MQGIIFPDAEEAWVQYLKPRLGGVKVGTRGRKDGKFVKILRAGGNRSNKMLDSPQMIYECYDVDDAKAAAFAAYVRALVHAAEGTAIAPGVHCKKLRDVSGPSYINDEEHDSSRYSFTVMTDLRGQPVPDLLDLEGTN